ncbi:hypothetical protein K8I85_13195, partial [bacterium]|nr:hypothetical protein [bacterium]
GAATDRPDLESDRFPAALRPRFVLAAPLRAGAGHVGPVLLGERRTGRHYVDREVQLLRDVAERVSGHLARIGLEHRVHEERAESRRLEALHRAKSEFLSRVSHDLRTPLTSISWSVQNLLDGVVGELDPRQREYVGEIEHSVSYLNRLVNNLLRMSRLERGELEAHCAPVDLREVVRRSVRTVGAAAAARDVRLSVPEDAAPARAWADAHLLEEALVNLLENAVQFSPPGATVDVSFESGDDGARVRVRDHGPGLPEGGAAALFERFTRGPLSPWSRHEGVGLGLSIARMHLQMMAGRLEAGEAPGGGAVFTCTLAVEAPPPGGTA